MARTRGFHIPFVGQGRPAVSGKRRRRVQYRPDLVFANNQLEPRLLLSLYVLSYVNLVDGPKSASSPTDSPISVDSHGVGDASASATKNSLSVEASGGDGLSSGSNASANGSWSYQILGVPTNVSIPLTFTYEFVGSNVATTSATKDFNLALSSYSYSIYSGTVTQSGTEQVTSQNGKIVYQSPSPAQAPGAITASFAGSGYLSAAIQAQAASTPGSGATASANAIFQLEGVSSSLQSQYSGLSLKFDNGDIVPVQPSPLASQVLKDNGPATDVPGNVQSGDPIDLNTGNVYRSVTDYGSAGPNTLDFTRYYNTYIGATDAATALGERWRSTYDRFIHLTSPTTAIAERATGQELAFTLKNGIWTADSDEDYRLTRTASGWTLADPQDNIETYADNGSSLGWLTAIQSRDGYTQTLLYNVRQQLASVSDSFGRSLIFTYQNGLLNTLTTPDGTTITYGYTGIGLTLRPDQLASVTYPTSPPTSRRYDYYPNGTLKDAIDQDGHQEASFAYDQWNRATLVYAGGNTAIDSVAVAYNNADGSRTVIDPLGLRSVYRFAMLQGVPKLTEIDRQPTGGPVTSSRFAYDANGYQASTTDWNGNVTLYANDAHGQPTAITEAAGTPLARTTLITYLSGFHLPALIVAPGETTGFAYDGKGDLLTLTQTDTTTQTVPYATGGQKHVWTYTYDTIGHVLTADGPRTDVSDKTTYSYSGNNISTVTNARGDVTRFNSYNPRGEPLSETDPNGVMTTLVYDPMGRELTRTVQTSAGAAVTRDSYDAAGLLNTQTQPDGSTLTYNYDTAQRLTGIKDPAGESITYSLDGMGNTTRQDTRNSAGVIVATRSQVYNQLDQIVKSIGATPAEVTSYGHDAEGNVTSITDALNHTTLQAFDALNRPVKSTDPTGGVTADGYDAQGNLASVTSPRGLKTSYVFNGFGQEIEVSSPDSGTTVYRLDPAGNVTSEIDARGIVTNRTFDALNRVTSETYPASISENIAYAYDSTAGGNRGIGHLTSYTDETGSTSYQYNELGLEVAQTQIIGGKSYTTAYAYNLSGKITQVAYPSGRIVGYGYDSQGRVNSVTTRATVTAPILTLASGVTYEPFGPLATLTYGNGLAMSRTFDADYRLTGIVTQGGGNTVQNLAFSYDAIGNVASETDKLTPANNQIFTYDTLNRLKTASGAYSSVFYTYDADSNRLTSTQGGVTQVYTYAATSDRLMSVSGSPIRSLAYLANGDIATDSRNGQPATYSFSNRNRLRQSNVSGLGIETNLYDAAGERLVTSANGVVTHFHFNQSGQLIAESNGSTGVNNREYVWLGSLPLAQIEANGTVEYIHADQTNTPEKMTNAAKAVVWDREQQPFGLTVSTTGTASSNLRAPGQYADMVSGLNYNLNRDYDPTLGRYIESDPIGLAGGINEYGYVGQNPTNASDPLGLCSSLACNPNLPYDGAPDLPLDGPIDNSGHSDVFVFGSGTLDTPGLFRLSGEDIKILGYNDNSGFYTGNILAGGAEVGGEQNYVGGFKGAEETSSDQTRHGITLEEISGGPEIPFLGGLGIGGGYYSITTNESGWYFFIQGSISVVHISVGFGFSA